MPGSRKALARLLAQGLVLVAAASAAGVAGAQPEWTIHRGNLRIQTLFEDDRPGNRGGTVIRTLNLNSNAIAGAYGGVERGDRIFANCTCSAPICDIFVGNGGDRDTPPECVQVIGQLVGGPIVLDSLGDGEDRTLRRVRGSAQVVLYASGLGVADIAEGDLFGEFDIRFRESSSGTDTCANNASFRRGTGTVQVFDEGIFPVSNATGNFGRRQLVLDGNITAGCTRLLPLNNGF